MAQLAARAIAKAAGASSSAAATVASIQDVAVQATAAEEYLQIDEQLALQSEVLQAGMEAYAVRVVAVDNLLALDENAPVDNVEGGEVAVEDQGHFDSAQDGEGDDDAMQVDDGGYFGEKEVDDVGEMDSVQSEEGEAQAQMVREALRDAITSYEGSVEAWSTLIAFLSSLVLKLDDNVRTVTLASIQASLATVDFSQGSLICQQFFTRYVKASFWPVQNIQEFMTVGNNHPGLYEGGALCASEALSVAFDLELFRMSLIGATCMCSSRTEFSMVQCTWRSGVVTVSVIFCEANVTRMSSRRHSTSCDLCTGFSLLCNADQCRVQINAYMLRMLHMCACNIKTKKNGNWLGLVMDLFGRLLDLSLENNAFPAALMDLFQKNSSRLIKLIVTARPNLSWHYGIGRVLLIFKTTQYTCNTPRLP